MQDEKQMSVPVDALGFPVGDTTPTTEMVRAGSDATARAKFEIMALVEVAMRFPRSESKAVGDMMVLADRPAFADGALYEFPRGKKLNKATGVYEDNLITGPSVRMARPIANCWRNLHYGHKFISIDEDWVHMQGVCHDVERGIYITYEDKFRQVHQRKDDDGKARWKRVDDRDLRELVNRRGALLVRNCIIHTIPTDVIDRVITRCERTLIDFEKGNLKQNRKDTITNLVVAFSAFGVTQEILEQKIGKKLDLVEPEELAMFRKIKSSLEDGNSRIYEHFDVPPPDSGAARVSSIDLAGAKSVEPKDPPGGATIGDVSKKGST